MLPSEDISASPIPVHVWTGRAWWQVFCGGCCLLIVLGFASALLMGLLYAKRGYQDFGKIPQRVLERVRNFHL